MTQEPERAPTESAALESSKGIVVLVHGTIPRIGPIRLFSNPSWIHPNSSFCKWFSEILPSSWRLRHFEWSGRNSHLARIEAAKSLAERLDTIAKELPPAKLCIVAHSHGGNVALYSLRYIQRATRLRISGIATLATPFIYCTRVSDFLKISRIATTVALVFCIITALLFSFAWAAHLALLQEKIICVSAWIMSPIAAFFCWLLNRRTESFWEKKMEEMQTEIVPKIITGIPLLCATINRDEAAGWLRYWRAWWNIWFGEWQLQLVPGLAGLILLGISMSRPEKEFSAAGVVIVLALYIVISAVWIIDRIGMAIISVSTLGFGQKFLWSLFLYTQVDDYPSDAVYRSAVIAAIQQYRRQNANDPKPSEPGIIEIQPNFCVMAKRQRLFSFHHAWLHEDEQTVKQVAGWLRSINPGYAKASTGR